jgi:uncharacterized protein YggE
MDKTLKTTLIFGIFIFSFSFLWFVYEYSKLRPELRTFSVSGEGKEVVLPNIAEIRIGVISEGQDLRLLQKENSEKMNRIISFLKKKGIDEKNIQTENYLVSPKYDYSKPPYKIVGYTINQDLRVKVRDLSKIGEILSQAVNYGANNVYGPNFIVDDKEVYLEKAREKAIKNAKEKAEKIAKIAGFRLGKIVSIIESSPYDYYPFMLEEKIGKGGESLPAVQPQIQPGSQEIKVQVNITYEIR